MLEPYLEIVDGRGQHRWAGDGFPGRRLLSAPRSRVALVDGMAPAVELASEGGAGATDTRLPREMGLWSIG